MRRAAVRNNQQPIKHEGVAIMSKVDNNKKGYVCPVVFLGGGQ